MARALSQILTELNSVYDPQRQSYQKQISALDPQQNAELKGLDASKQDAFQQITDQANRRGLFYSGIPIGEQQRYTGANYLPAVANLKNRYAQQRFSLQDALSGLTKEQYGRAYDVRQNELALEQQRAAAAAAANSFSPSFDGNSFLQDYLSSFNNQSGPQVKGAKTAVDPTHQKAYDHVVSLLSSNDPNRIANNYASILQSANKGREFDKIQLELFAQLAPKYLTDKKLNSYGGAFGNFIKQIAPSALQRNVIPGAALANGSQLRF
jgi:hypothetical protein